MRELTGISGMAVLVVVIFGPATGCKEQHFSVNVLNPLNLELPFLPYKEPIRIGIAQDRRGVFDPANWQLAEIGMPSTPLRRKMEAKIGRPIHIEYFTPFQVAAHLKSGRLQFGMLSENDAPSIREEFGSIQELGTVIAMSEELVRQGLIVARSSSSIQSLGELRGKRFAFGPSGDAVLDQGARNALTAAGVSPDSLQKELIPIPGTFQHHITANESAFEIVYGLGTEAGVIEKADYDAMPEKGGNAVLRTFGKNQFRILGTTEPHAVDSVGMGPFIASDRTDAELVTQVTRFLLNAGTKHRAELARMGLAGFHPPSADMNGRIDRSKSVKHSSPDMITLDQF